MSSIPKPTRFLNYLPNNQTNKDAGLATGQSDSETDLSTSNENLSHDERYSMRNMPRQEPQGQENRGSQDSTYNTLIIHSSIDESRIPTRKGQGMHTNSYKVNSSNDQKTLAGHSMREINSIPDDYLSQSQVLKHLAKEVKGSEESGSGWRNESRLSMRHLSKSQPDLSRLNNLQYYNFRNTLGNSMKEQRCMQMVDLVLQENNNLKLELESCYQRVKKSLKLEEEIAKVHRGHEELVASCERRERLERAARTRLQTEVRRLQEANRALREQAELMSSHAHSSQFVDVPEITKREAIIAQLIAQNKELVAAKERQEIELAAQRATLEEQRTHIDILDTALTNAQSNVVRLEEECRKKQIHVERVAQLQRALSSLQLASDRREQTERKLRLQLEQELRNERARNTQNTSGLGMECEPGESLPELKRRLREKDEKIMRLEGEVSKWEQRYLEESELRQAAIDAASIPKDAKIAALEKTSQESEKLIAEARSDKIRQMDEVHAAQKKVTELESRMKELESKLAERDAMIRVLQKKHTIDKEVVSGSYPSISLSHHTQHSSLNTSDLSNVLTADDLGPVSTGVFSTVSSVLTSSTGFDSSTSYTGSVDSAFHHRRDKYSSANQSFDHKSLDDQLKELDSQLLSKRGLCCFPGFSHPGASSRKGKISQPLLAGVGPSSLPLFEAGGFLKGLVSGGSNREDDMVLLEKQGLCSQQQRQPEQTRGSSLPPSSLPRPRRHRNAGGGRLGEYGRLSDSESSVRKLSSDSTDLKSRESPRKLGEYGRLSNKTSSMESNVEVNSQISSKKLVGDFNRLMDRSRKTSANSSADTTCDHSSSSNRESPARKYPSYQYSERKAFNDENAAVGKPRDSPGRSLIVKLGDYNRFADSRKSSVNSNPSEVSNIKVRDSPVRCFIPPPRKLSDYGCFASRPDMKHGTSNDSKLPIFSPSNALKNRRGSLQHSSPKTTLNDEGVRSLPTPNKYRIQF